MICCLSGGMPMPESVTEIAMTSVARERLVFAVPAVVSALDRQRHAAPGA
jgi:hypothetical protein